MDTRHNRVGAGIMFEAPQSLEPDDFRSARPEVWIRSGIKQV